jgi:glyoxylase-like metal-dependent hydrolase (beta-lactamase superfamily II)
MLRWRVGTVEVVRIDASSFVLPSPVPMPSWAVPWLTPSVGEAPVAFSALAIRSGDQRIVVDPWLADDGPRSRPDAAVIIDGLLRELAEAGFPAERVDTVVNTHLDGIGWNTRPSADGWVPTFPRARYLFPAAELAAVDRGVRIAGGDELGPLRDAGVLEAIELPHVLTPEVMLETAPGHNYGHAAVRIDSEGDLAVYPGHLVLSLLQIDAPERNVGEADLVTATATRRRILGELADRRGLLLTTLIGGPGAGTVARAAAGFRLAPLTIATADDGRPECG